MKCFVDPGGHRNEWQYYLGNEVYEPSSMHFFTMDSDTCVCGKMTW